MIDPDLAEKAVDFLRESAKEFGGIWTQARQEEHNLKRVEAELVKEYHLKGTPTTVCKEYARADPRWAVAAELDANATGVLKDADSRREAAKILIGLFQSQVKDRM